MECNDCELWNVCTIDLCIDDPDKEVCDFSEEELECEF